MSKIEVGEYVRTNDGIIDKIDHYENDTKLFHCEKNHYIDPFNYVAIPSSEVKHSKDIIDLIEEGDYVNGNEVVDKYLFNGEKPVLETTGNGINDKCLCNGDIKTVVTHEQMSSIEYKV